MTPGFAGADLENLMNEAALLAVRRKHRFITMEDIDEAILKVQMGPEKKSRKMSDKAKRLTAYHESGHAVAARCGSCSLYHNYSTRTRRRLYTLQTAGGSGELYVERRNV